jgi:OFA family oxalate/formate antiporter-like MFS transporter
MMQSLPLFYLFFGVVSGIGLGVGYISPVSTLVKWFPDRRGLATGLAIMGFGFGGLVCAKLVDLLVPVQQELVIPRVLVMDASGTESTRAYDFIKLLSDDPGRADALTANAPDVASYKALEARMEVLHSAGQAADAEYLEAAAIIERYHRVLLFEPSQIAWAFIILAVLYACVMVPSALYIAPPPADWAQRMKVANGAKKSSSDPIAELSARQAVRTFGFWGLWVMLFINVSCGIAVIATAKKMGYEMVRLTPEMSTWLVMGISLFNGLGRIFWASLSDHIGRANTYILFFGIQIICFPLLAHITGLPLMFMLVTFVILTCYGGGFASIPAYISDLFGIKEMPTIHGYVLTAWSLAGVVGPMLNAFVYERTASYQGSLYIFGSAFVVALVVAIMMKWEMRRLRRHYSDEEVAAARPFTHDL